MSQILGKFPNRWPPLAASSKSCVQNMSPAALWEQQLVREILNSELELLAPLRQCTAPPLHPKADPIWFDLKMFLNLSMVKEENLVASKLFRFHTSGHQSTNDVFQFFPHKLIKRNILKRHYSLKVLDTKICPNPFGFGST